MNLSEATSTQRIPEKSAHTMLNCENGLVSARPQINDTIVKSRVLADSSQIVVGLGPHRVLDENGQTRLGGAHNPQLTHMQLNTTLAARLHLGRTPANEALHVNDTLPRDARRELDKLLADLLELY
jgi:hypothetical protein